MKARVALALTLGLTLISSASAQTVIVNETFESYATREAFLAQWVPTIGNGSSALATSDSSYLAGLLTDDAEFPSPIPDVQGKAVDHISATASTPGMVNQYGGAINQGAGMNPTFTINPSATQNVFLSADIYESGQGNERMSVGLRHIGVSGTTVTTTNILELGLYNSNSADATVVGSANPAQNAVAGSPGFYNGRGYGSRVINFGPAAAPLTHQPDWQYFRTTGETWGGQAGGDIGFALELESTTDTNDFVSIGDVGAGWHRYTATISPTSITITLDLYRDGLRNTSRTPDPESGIRPGSPGVDAQMVYPVSTNALGFNSLRIGGPSGLLSAGPGAVGFDNLLLELRNVVAPPMDDADFDGDGDIDGQDFLTWQRGNGISDGSADIADGDANDDGNVTAADLAIWKTQYATASVAAAAIPEPASIALAALAILAGVSASRRR